MELMVERIPRLVFEFTSAAILKHSVSVSVFQMMPRARSLGCDAGVKFGFVSSDALSSAGTASMTDFSLLTKFVK